MSHLAPGSRPPPWPATSTSVCRLAAFVPRSSPVLADRGLYAGWPFRRIVRLGWHPFLRLNAGGTLRPAGSRRSTRYQHSCRTLVPAGMALEPPSKVRRASSPA